MSGNEISQILLVLILSYLGQGNRPVWIAWGVIISGISCYILALPHFIYGPGPAALALTAEHLNETIFNSTSKYYSERSPAQLSTQREVTHMVAAVYIFDVTSIKRQVEHWWRCSKVPSFQSCGLDFKFFHFLVLGTGNPFLCNPDRPEKTCSSVDIQSSLVPMILLFLSQFVLGIGTSLYFSLGQTYMDDNTKKTNTPLLLGE